MTNREPLSKALHFTSLLIGIGAVLTGIAAANVHGNAESLPAILCLLFVIFTQLAANCYHHYHSILMMTGLSHKAAIKRSQSVNGINRVIFYRIFAFGVGLLAIMTGLTIISVGGIWFGLIGVIIMLLTYLMVGVGRPVMLTPWAPALTFIMFGPIAVISTSMLQSIRETSDPLSWYDIHPPIFLSVTVGFMAANAYIAYAYSSYFKGKGFLKNTLPGVIGRRNTRILFLVNSLLAFGVMVWSCFWIAGTTPWLGLTPYFISLVINLVIWRRMRTLPRYKLSSLADWVCINLFIMGFLSFILSFFMGVPDDSHMQIF